MAPIQKRLRDIARLIQRNGETPELKQRLAALTAERDYSKLKEKQRKHSIKYHMVKFLERKKLTRMIRVLDKKIRRIEEETRGGASSREREELLSAKRDFEDRLTYVMYYPPEQKYIALFASKDDEEAPSSSSNEASPQRVKDFNSVRVLAASIAERMSTKLEGKMAKMLELAKAARKADIEASKGRRDRVKHAMDVEYGRVGNEEASSDASKGRNSGIGEDSGQTKGLGAGGTAVSALGMGKRVGMVERMSVFNPAEVEAALEKQRQEREKLGKTFKLVAEFKKGDSQTKRSTKIIFDDKKEGNQRFRGATSSGSGSESGGESDAESTQSLSDAGSAAGKEGSVVKKKRKAASPKKGNSGDLVVSEVMQEMFRAKRQQRLDPTSSSASASSSDSACESESEGDRKTEGGGGLRASRSSRKSTAGGVAGASDIEGEDDPNSKPKPARLGRTALSSISEARAGAKKEDHVSVGKDLLQESKIASGGAAAADSFFLEEADFVQDGDAENNDASAAGMIDDSGGRGIRSAGAGGYKGQRQQAGRGGGRGGGGGRYQALQGGAFLYNNGNGNGNGNGSFANRKRKSSNSVSGSNRGRDFSAKRRLSQSAEAPSDAPSFSQSRSRSAEGSRFSAGAGEGRSGHHRQDDQDNHKKKMYGFQYRGGSSSSSNNNKNNSNNINNNKVKQL